MNPITLILGPLCSILAAHDLVAHRYYWAALMGYLAVEAAIETAIWMNKD